MLGDPSKNDKNFTPESYEDFYAHHFFLPIDEERALHMDDLLPRFRWAIEKLGEIRPDTLLDLGCLDGSFALTVANRFGTTVTGVDLTVDGIQLAQDRAKKFGIDNATFVQGAAETYLRALARKKVKFDVVTFFEVIEHVEDVQVLLSLVDKVLAPGGTVLLSTPSFEDPHYGLDDEQNTCHIRLYTTRDEDYDKENKFGHLRHATSMSQEIGSDRIQEMQVVGEQICVRYK